MSHYDYGVIGLYLVISFLVSLYTFKKASTGKVSYFLGGRQLPWWWAGLSIAATTFAADTPLAVTGLIAKNGFSGNWIWLSWIIMHAATAIFFARSWRQSEVITDSQLISIRYSGPHVQKLRLFKAGFYALFFNCLILGWVIKAMLKVISPFLSESILSGYEVYLLLLLVMVYSSTGGIRAVLITDILQIFVAVAGSYTLAYYAMAEIGGFEQLKFQLINLYGEGHRYTNFFPEVSQLGFNTVAFAAPLFMLYLIAQAFSSSPADGGGYLMQRLGACDNVKSARKATMLFIFIQYFLRVWPWVIVGLAAIVIFPLTETTSSLGVAGEYDYVFKDRESGYPALMQLLLPPGLLGLALAGMVAAFMSTVDTHLNWGSSYIVNDFLPHYFPNQPPRRQVLIGRISAIFFTVSGILVSFMIDQISDAWKLLALFGACFSAPTLLRWFWWRVNIQSEFYSIIIGVLTAIIMGFIFEVQFEVTLVCVFVISILTVLITGFLTPPSSSEALTHFVSRTEPYGFWGPYQEQAKSHGKFLFATSEYLSLVLTVVSSLFFGQALINARPIRSVITLTLLVLFLTLFFYFKRKKQLQA